MGRLTEYIGGGGTHTAYIDGGSSGTSGVKVTGADEIIMALNRIITKDATMEREMRKIIRRALQKARNDTSKDVRQAIENDPRKAYKAVLHNVYKKTFGGSVNILSKRKRGAPTNYQEPRTLKPGQRGGNRRKASANTERMKSYGGADRGFVLRFLNAGTDVRQTRTGNRGSIAPRGIFSRIAPWHMETAAENVAVSIEEFVIQTLKNG